VPGKLLNKISLAAAFLTLLTSATPISPASSEELSASKKIALVKTITGAIAPKSVEASNSGLVSAHNMMYRHSVTLYNAQTMELEATIPDSVRFSDFGYTKYSGRYKGSPVEGAFSPDGNYLYFTNYAMYGKGFKKEGTDTCSPSDNYDKSFLSRVDLSTKKIDAVYPVGSVPKVVKVSPDNKYILVSNWCSYTVSIISVEEQTVVKTIKIGRYPRGIAILPMSPRWVATEFTRLIWKISQLNTFLLDQILERSCSPLITRSYLQL
jgi:YVTN family beta-propeller protein